MTDRVIIGEPAIPRAIYTIPGYDYRRAFSLERRANGAIRLRGLCLIYRRRFIIATPCDTVKGTFIKMPRTI